MLAASYTQSLNLSKFLYCSHYQGKLGELFHFYAVCSELVLDKICCFVHLNCVMSNSKSVS